VDENSSLADRWLALGRAYESSTTRIERVLARDHHLCVSAYVIMERMHTAGTWVRVPDLTRTVSRSQPQISRLITQMLDAGYVDRERDPVDARGSRIRLTPSGKKAFRAAAATIDSELRQVVDEDELLTPWLGTTTVARNTADA
jgi:DNA-binding MarR family transcriptional regulator